MAYNNNSIFDDFAPTTVNYEPVHKVLLVEDNPADAHLVEILLAETDFIKCNIINKVSLAAAIDALQRETDYEAVLLDLTLPDSRGFETLERLFAKVPDANVIVLTGLSDKQIGINAVKAGAQDFLIKGAFDTDVLAKSLRYSIERSSVLKRLEETQRIAHIGSWEYNTNTQKATLSDEVYRIFGQIPEKIALTRHQLSVSNHPFHVLYQIHKETLEHKSIKKDIKIDVGDGSKRWVYVQCHIDKHTQPSPMLSGIVQDITERMQAEELRKARDVAQQSAQLKEQFIASISHEMRTPMNAILGMSNLLLKAELSEEHFSYINSIKQSSEILLGIVNDILEISTIQNGKITFEANDFDLYELLNNLVSVMHYKMVEKDLLIQLNIAPDIPQFLKGDKLRLNQILYNLVGNAIKFTDKGHVRTSISIAEQKGRQVRLRFDVEDTGIGIPDDKLDAIFDTFTRIRTKDRIYEGTGLGLSIAKNLIVQQGGSLGVTSKLGVGSVFYFDIWFELGEKALPTDLHHDQNVDIKTDNAVKLLLVEDHKMNQLVARKTLEKHWKNIEITIADNGQKAVEILTINGDFDVILMDIQMPIMDGYETTAHIRTKMPEHISKLPVLAMTAHAHISKEERFKEYGFDDFVLKPFEPDDLFYKIAKYANKGGSKEEEH